MGTSEDGGKRWPWGAILIGILFLITWAYTGYQHYNGNQLSEYLRDTSEVVLSEHDSTPFYQWIKTKHEDELDRLAIAGRDLTQQVMILSADVNRIADQVNVTTTALNEVHWPAHDRHLPPPPPPDW